MSLAATEPMEQPSANTPEPASDAQQTPEEGGLLLRQGARLQARLQPIIRVAGAMAGKVRTLALLSALAGLWLWGVIFYPFDAFGQIRVVVPAVVVVILLLIPAGVLVLFWAGLRELISVPDKLVEAAGQSQTHAGALLETVSDKTERRKVRRLWRFFRTVLDLRALLLESKGLLLQFAVVARVANPVFIGVLFVAFVLSLLLILAAAISVLVVVF